MTMIDKRKRRRKEPVENTGDEQPLSMGLVFVLVMALIAVICLIVGFVRHGMNWTTVLTACISLVTGIGFVAIGLLELEWLERVIGFVDGIVSGIWQYLWTTRVGSLDEHVGRRGATVLWVIVGLPIFVWGCLLALRFFEI